MRTVHASHVLSESVRVQLQSVHEALLRSSTQEKHQLVVQQDQLQSGVPALRLRVSKLESAASAPKICDRTATILVLNQKKTQLAVDRDHYRSFLVSLTSQFNRINNDVAEMYRRSRAIQTGVRDSIGTLFAELQGPIDSNVELP